MFIDDLIARYENKEEFFTITLPDGEELKFRFVSDYSELQTLQSGAVAFCKKMQKGEAVLPDWKPFLTDNVDTLTAVYVLAYTIEDKKLTEFDLLRLAKKAGPIFQYILNQYNLKETEHIVRSEIKEIEDAKND